MIQVVFNGAGCDESERKVQASIAKLIKTKVGSIKCGCVRPHIVIKVAGSWRSGEIEVAETACCCLSLLDEVTQSLEKICGPERSSGVPLWLAARTANGLLGQQPFLVADNDSGFSLR